MQPLTEDALGKEQLVKRYVVKQKALALGESFTIECIERGKQHKAFQVHGTPIPLLDKLSLRDADGNELLFLQEKMVKVRDAMTIYQGGEKQELAKVQKTLPGPLLDHFRVYVKGAPEMETEGNCRDYEYVLDWQARQIARVSKQWDWVKGLEAYGVEIESGQDDALLLAIAICIDLMVRAH